MGTEIEVKIGREIVRARRAKHWSQERLAREAGVSRHYLSEVENGSRQVSVSMVVRIWSVLTETEVGELFRVLGI